MPGEGTRALGSRYELRELIGRGAMGEVWKAWDSQGNRSVAAKLLHRHFAQDVPTVGRFVQERSILMGLRHPNIVEVIDMVVEGDDLAIIMPLVEGGSLGAYCSRVRTLPPRTAVSIACGVLAGIAYAHEQGVLHRDVKPDNVLLTDHDSPGEHSVLLSDFGIARLAQEETVHVTGLLGTPAYMPPEMFESGVFSQASDVYAIGIMAYELLAGRTPFEGGDSPIAVGMRHAYSLPPVLPVDARLWRALEQMLSKDPRNRLTAQDTLAGLRELSEDALSGPALPAQPEPKVWQGLPDKPAISGSIKVRQVSGDVGQTYVTPVVDPIEPLAMAGEVRAVVNTGGSDTDKATMLGDPRRSADPVLAAAAPAPETPKSRKRPWIIGASVVAVVLAVALVIWLPRGSRQEPAMVYTPGHAIGTELATGLRIDFEADNGPDPGTVSLVVAVNAAKTSGLAGDILLAFPPDSPCPVIASTDWDASITPIQRSVDGLDAPCGHRVPIKLAAGQTRRITLVLSGVSVQDLGSWIGSVQSSTQATLRTVVGSDFPLQRVSGVRVTAQDVRLDAGMADTVVPYQVYPTWADQTETTTDPLFSDETLDFQATDLLLSLTGGEGFARVSVTSCDATQVIGRRVLAQQSSSSCQVQVSVGALDPAQTSFSIRMAPS